MKIFVDTANLDEIKAAMDLGFVDGVTTNPSLLAKEPKGRFEEHIGKIIEILNQNKVTDVFDQHHYKHLSVEVFSKDPVEIMNQAAHFKATFRYPALSVKVQIGWPELAVIRDLARRDVSVNCTACMTVSQAVWAAKSGARYASLFWGRIRDASPEAIELKQGKCESNPTQWDFLEKHRLKSLQLLRDGILTNDDCNPASVVRRTREIFDREKFNCEIIAGSIRTIWDVRDAMLAGAHIVTVPYKFFDDFPKMVQHFKTDEVLNQFLTEYADWLKKPK